MSVAIAGTAAIIARNTMYKASFFEEAADDFHIVNAIDGIRKPTEKDCGI